MNPDYLGAYKYVLRAIRKGISVDSGWLRTDHERALSVCLVEAGVRQAALWHHWGDGEGPGDDIKRSRRILNHLIKKYEFNDIRYVFGKIQGGDIEQNATLIYRDGYIAAEEAARDPVFLSNMFAGAKIGQILQYACAAEDTEEFPYLVKIIGKVPPRDSPTSIARHRYRAYSTSGEPVLPVLLYQQMCEDLTKIDEIIELARNIDKFVKSAGIKMEIVLAEEHEEYNIFYGEIDDVDMNFWV